MANTELASMKAANTARVLETVMENVLEVVAGRQQPFA